MEIVEFKPKHINDIQAQTMQKEWLLYWKPGYAEYLRDNGIAYSAVIDGKVIGCAGIFKHWEGRGEAWALFDSSIRTHFIGITRAILRALSVTDFRRVEANVRHDFKAAHEWMLYLGFTWEGTMKNFGIDGMDYDRFARVK